MGRAVFAVACAIVAAVVSPALAVPANVQWHPGIAVGDLRAAHVVRIAPGFHKSDLALLRDDQVVETTQGRHVPVARLRLIMETVAKERARTAQRRAPQFAILAPMTAPCTPPGRGETLAHLLARPASDSICTPSGRPVSVAQLRAMAPYVARHPELRARLGMPARVSAGEIRIANAADLRTKARTTLRNAPDSTVLVSPKGTKITLGALRAFLRSRTPPGVKPLGGRTVQ
jgi:hypothetical protein